MRGSFEVAASPCFCFLGFLPGSPSSSSSAAAASPLSPPRRPSNSLSLSFSPSLLQGQPFRYSFVSWRLPLSCLSSSFFLLPPLSTRPLIRCAQASRSFLLLPPRRPYVPHSCGIAPSWPTFYNPVPVSRGGADLHRCSPTLSSYEDALCYLCYLAFVVVASTTVYRTL